MCLSDKGVRVIKVGVLGLLFVAFGIQVRDNVSKFIGKRTTLSFNKSPAKELFFPIFSFCPGFKQSDNPLPDYYATYFDMNGTDGT